MYLNLGGELVYFCFYIVFHIIVYMSFFPHIRWCVLECFQERQVHSNQDLLHLFVTSRLGVLDWDLWCIWAFYCIWELCYVVCVFCHGLPKGEIVRFWVCNVGKPWQNMRKTKSHWFRMVYIKVEHKKLKFGMKKMSYKLYGSIGTWSIENHISAKSANVKRP